MTANKNTYKNLCVQLDIMEDNHFNSYLKNLCETKIHRPRETHITSREKRNFLKLNFVNHHMNNLRLNDTLLRLNDTLKNGDVRILFPLSLRSRKIRPHLPIPVWQYDKPVSSVILNHRQSVTKMNVDETIRLDYSCQCINNEYMDPNHKHVITGNLKALRCSDVENILAKGVSFRLPNSNDIDSCLNSLHSNLQNYCETFTPEYRMKEFQAWIDKILEISYSNLIKREKYTKFEKETINNAKLRYLKRKYVFTKVDKAGQNYAVICKQFYLKKICQEVNLNLSNNQLQTQSDTYQLTTYSTEQCITHMKNECRKLGFSEFKTEGISYLYLLPKFHKNPVKFRPIVASTKAVTKNLSEKLSIALKLINRRIENYSNTITKCTRIRPYWIVKNNQPILDCLEKLSKRKNA